MLYIYKIVSEETQFSIELSRWGISKCRENLSVCVSFRHLQLSMLRSGFWCVEKKLLQFWWVWDPRKIGTSCFRPTFRPEIERFDPQNMRHLERFVRRAFKWHLDHGGTAFPEKALLSGSFTNVNRNAPKSKRTSCDGREVKLTSQSCYSAPETVGTTIFLVRIHVGKNSTSVIVYI